jgi:DNA processing protein
MLVDNLPRAVPKRGDVSARVAPEVAVVGRAEARYPARLREVKRPPVALWYRGRLTDRAPLVAIVGSRAASGDGCARARALAAALGGAGVSVVSGGALGIDAAAHQGGLEAGAPTWAVLGCGVDVVYPDRHGPLFDRIVGAGGLLSEYPPGTPPRPGQFPARNELIVGLADVVVVIEAAVRSGALITARLAGAAGRPVLAMPGSPGTAALLAGGKAHPCGGAPDVLAVLRGEAPVGAGMPPASPVTPADGPIRALVEALRASPDDAAGLARRLRLPLATVMGALTEAELDGWVRRTAGHLYEVGHGHGH